MPKKVFYELDKDKQNRVTEAALMEFGQYGYENSSTNRIVVACGISKGSLFKYFESKEELYFYLIDTVSGCMAREMKVNTDRLPADLYERVLAYSVAEIAWYAANPVKGRFIISVATESDPQICRKILDRYGDRSNDIYLQLLEGVDMSGLHSSREDVTDILRWVLQGFNAGFLANISGTNDDIDRIRDEYMKQLKRYLEILKNGL